MASSCPAAQRPFYEELMSRRMLALVCSCCAKSLLHTHTHTLSLSHTHTYIHIYMHTYVRTYIHTYVYTYIHTYILHTYIRINIYIPTFGQASLWCTKTHFAISTPVAFLTTPGMVSICMPSSVLTPKASR